MLANGNEPHRASEGENPEAEAPNSEGTTREEEETPGIPKEGIEEGRSGAHKEGKEAPARKRDEGGGEAGGKATGGAEADKEATEGAEQETTERRDQEMTAEHNKAD